MARTPTGTTRSTGSERRTDEALSNLLGILRAFDVLAFDDGDLHITLERKRHEVADRPEGENKPAELTEDDYRYAHVGRRPIKLASLKR